MSRHLVALSGVTTLRPQPQQQRCDALSSRSGLRPAYQRRSGRSWAGCFRPLKLIPKEFSVFPIEYPRVPLDGRPRAAAIARALEK